MSAKAVHEDLVHEALEPLDGRRLVPRRLDVAEHLGEHEAEKREELVDPEVVDLVPVLVKDVEARLEPLPLAFIRIDSLHDLTNLHGGLLLVDGLVGMPEHYVIMNKVRLE